MNTVRHTPFTKWHQ